MKVGMLLHNCEPEEDAERDTQDAPLDQLSIETRAGSFERVGALIVVC